MTSNSSLSHATDTNQMSAQSFLLLAVKMGVNYGMLLPDPWATRSEYDDSWNVMTHSRTVHSGSFTGTISRTIADEDLGVEVAVNWPLEIGGRAGDDMRFDIPAEQIPGLISLLQEVQRILTEPPRLLRRSAGVDAELQLLDA